MKIAHPDISDIKEIMHLNDKYLTQHLTDAQQRNGFLGKKYAAEELERIIADNEIIIASDQGKIAGCYLIGHKNDAAALHYTRNKAVASLVTDEVPYSKIAWPCLVCIDEGYRGKGLFGNMLRALMEGVKEKYIYVLCSISERNIVSIKAHMNNEWQLINTFEERQYFVYKTRG